MLDTLMSENDLSNWNLHPQKNGAIMLKVKFTEPVESDKETFIRSSSFRKLSDNQCKRNHLRAKSFREKQPEKKRKLSVEMPRNEEFSTPAPEFDLLNCCDSVYTENSSSRNVEETVISSCNSSSKHDEESSCVDGRSELRALHEEPSLSETKISIIEKSVNQPTPFDSDNESEYDENAPHMVNWQEFRGQCTDLNCHYNPDVEIGHPDLNQRWGLRPNGTFLTYFACALCGRVICGNCVWIRRRHYHHRYHVNYYSRSNPPDPINVRNLDAGIH